ncbi:MAG: hypothetical protein U1G08_22220 [Verrucomicrobiota bacterium]
MLRLENRSTPQIRPPTGGAKRLAVAWLHGDLAVTAIGDGKSRDTWTAPAPVPHVRDLGPALRDAMESLGCPARSLTMVLAHEDLVQCRIEMPRVRASVRRRFLQRQAEQAPSPAAPLHWASRPAATSGTPDAALLSLISRTFLDAVVSACTENGLTPTMLLPFSELLGQCRPGAENFGGGFLMLVTKLGRTTELLILRGDGMPVVARTGTADSSSGNIRLTGEILRTLQFVQQNFGEPISRICWLWPDSMPASASENASIQSISQRVPEAETAGYWAGRLASLPDSYAINLLAPEQREASSRRLVTTLHRALAALSLTAAAIFLVFSERVRTQEHANIRRLKEQLGPLEIREQELRQLARVHAGQRTLIQRARECPGAEAPLCILGQIGNELPRDLQLTNVQIASRNGGWDVNVSGKARTSARALSDVVGGFSNSLREAPLFIQWLQASNAGPTSGFRDAWKARWTETLAPPSPQKVASGFMLEGRIP